MRRPRSTRTALASVLLAGASVLLPRPASAVIEWLGLISPDGGLTVIHDGFVSPDPPVSGTDVLEIGTATPPARTGDVYISESGGNLTYLDFITAEPLVLELPAPSAPGSSFTFGGLRIHGSGSSLTVEGAGQSLEIAPTGGEHYSTGSVAILGGATFVFDATAGYIGQIEDLSPSRIAGSVGGEMRVEGGSSLVFRTDDDDPISVRPQAVVFAGDAEFSGGSTLRFETNDTDVGGALVGFENFSWLRLADAGTRLEMLGDAPRLEIARNSDGRVDLSGGAIGESKLLSIGTCDDPDPVTCASVSGLLQISGGSTYSVQGSIPDSLAFPGGRGPGAAVGQTATGTISIFDGGHFVLDATENATNAGMTLGVERNETGVGNGTVAVVGATSTFDVVGAGVQVGLAGIGRFEVLEGATATMQGMAVAFGSEAEGSVVVRGAGSVLDVGPGMSVGLIPNTNISTGGIGMVEIADGGTLIGGTIGLGTGATLQGDGTVVGTILNFGGTVAPGLSPGRLRVDGNLGFFDGELVIEIEGTGEGQFDVLEVLGNVSVTGGSLRFEVAPGVDLSEGIDVEFLVASQILNFAGIDVTAFQGGQEVQVQLSASASGLSASLVPEPAAWLLVGSGLVALRGRRRAGGRRAA